VVVRHSGYTAVVKVSTEVNWEGNPIPQDIDIEDHPEGGANALNVNRSVNLSWGVNIHMWNWGPEYSINQLAFCFGKPLTFFTN
jgi:hypothetical protein